MSHQVMGNTDMLKDQSHFKSENVIEHKLAQRAPKCIERLKTNMKREPLTNEEMTEAKKDCLNTNYIKLKYPRQRKLRIDPEIEGQKYGIIAFIPSEQATPDADGCYGVIKLRGCFNSLRETNDYAEKLIRHHDSLVENHIVYVGRDIPLMKDSSIYTKETVEIDLSKAQDDITKSYLRQKKENERKEREDVQKRHDFMVSKDVNKDKEESTDTIEFYTKLRQKKAYNLKMIKTCAEKIKEAEEVLKRIIPEQEVLDEKFPDYKNQFIEEYERSLRNINAALSDNEIIPIMKADLEKQLNSADTTDTTDATDATTTNDAIDSIYKSATEVKEVERKLFSTTL